MHIQKQKKWKKPLLSPIIQVIEMFDGDIKKFVNDTLVIKQHYLKRERNQHVEDAEQYDYFWGDRADAEIKQSLVFKMICEVRF